MERQHFVSRRFLRILDPAAIVINAIPATAIDVKIDVSEGGKQGSIGAFRGGDKYRAIKLASAPTHPLERRCAAADDQDDTVPSRVSGVREIPGHNQNATAGLWTQGEITVDDDCAGSAGGRASSQNHGRRQR